MLINNHIYYIVISDFQFFINQNRNTTGEINSFLHLNTPKYKVFEPDYLDSAGLVPPTYPPINIQVSNQIDIFTISYRKNITMLSHFNEGSNIS